MTRSELSAPKQNNRSHSSSGSMSPTNGLTLAMQHSKNSASMGGANMMSNYNTVGGGSIN
jgi:hypothetical protein